MVAGCEEVVGVYEEHRETTKSCEPVATVSGRRTHEPSELSERASSMLGVQDSSTENYREVYTNKYHPVKNPNGKINFCMAENNICEDLLVDKLSQMDLWKPDFSHLFHYPVAGGFDETKEALIPYFEKFLLANVRKENLVLAPGCTAAYDMLAFCVCDPGDYVLCPAPYYGRIANDFTERAGAEVIPVPFRDSSHPKFEVSAFQDVYAEHILKGNSIRALILVNPQNPHGTFFSKEEVIAICDWASDHKIVVIIDEIFASSVYRNEMEYESFLSYSKCLKQPDNVVWMWSFSKDLCMPGLKFAVMHTENRKFIQCLQRLELMQPCAPLAQDFVIKFLKDLDWLESFHKENVRRLEDYCKIATEALTKMGVHYVSCNSALYLYCDFRDYLEEDTFAAEYAFWRKLCNEGVHLSTGKYFRDPQPGWMRLVFTCDKNELRIGLARIESALKKMTKRSERAVKS